MRIDAKNKKKNYEGDKMKDLTLIPNKKEKEKEILTLKLLQQGLARKIGLGLIGWVLHK